MAVIAMVMPAIGGRSALQGIPNLVTVMAIPFALVLGAMVLGLWKDLCTDPLAPRVDYAWERVRQATRRGIAEHGDEWQFAVEPDPEGGLLDEPERTDNGDGSEPT